MINIKEKFIQLTNKRTPKGTEQDIIDLIPEFKFEKDEFGNFFYIIKKDDGTHSNTMFTSHLDTIDRGPYTYSKKVWDSVNGVYIDSDKNDDKFIKHVFEDYFIKTDGNTNLGADDKAGVVLMLNLMSEGVPGLYYFFMGEESGCIGSSNMSRVYEDKVKNGVLPKVNKCVSFDRRGYDSIITNQNGMESCSDEFAKDLSNKLNEYGFWFKPDSGGIYTDSAEFVDIIPECTNISVGYFNEHTTTEKQDIEFLEFLGIVITKIDWENITIKRDPINISYKGKKSKTYGGYNEHNYGYDYGYNYYDDYYNESYYKPKNNIPKNNTKTKPNTYFDNGVDGLIKLDDTEFDKWYMEQKNKGWTANDIKDEVTVD